ncbi:MAG: ATP-binding protein [Candidatus Verstraetearchaeota archaeon]|nr:ATP-binding protein [Candidatus Verstraetearchaeota archaeon]
MHELIEKHNPWWFGREDITINAWRSQRIRWVPKWIHEISLTPFSFNIITGSRQVGKTTGIKLLIQQLVEQNPPESVFYFNCDFLPDIHALRKLLETYMEFKRSKGLATSYIFLDEITSVPEWWRILKGFIDLGAFEKDVVTVTGSSSLRLRGETELFPGRRGEGRTICVYPLSFREFLEVHGVQVEATGDLEKDMRRLLPLESTIRELFNRYLEAGGYPLSINSHPSAEEQFIAAFEGEILRAGRSLQLTKEVIAAIIRKAPSPTPYLAIGREIGISYKTVQEYVELLKRLLILDEALYRSDAIKWRKERKFFFLDPFAARTLALWVDEKPLEAALYEWVVQAHLQRRFGAVYYYRDSYEVDCIARDLKIEVKAGKPHRRYPKKVMILDREALPLFLSVIV